MGCGGLRRLTQLGNGATDVRRDRHVAAGRPHVSRGHLFGHVTSAAQGICDIQAPRMALQALVRAVDENAGVDVLGAGDVWSIAAAIQFPRSHGMGCAGFDRSLFFSRSYLINDPRFQSHGESEQKTAYFQGTADA